MNLKSKKTLLITSVTIIILCGLGGILYYDAFSNENKGLLYDIQTVHYESAPDTFYFLDFNHQNDYHILNWTLSDDNDGDIEVKLMDFNNFNAWNLGYSYNFISDLSDTETYTTSFKHLPSQTTSPPQNALVIVFIGDSSELISITIEFHRYQG